MKPADKSAARGSRGRGLATWRMAVLLTGALLWGVSGAAAGEGGPVPSSGAHPEGCPQHAPPAPVSRQAQAHFGAGGAGAGRAEVMLTREERQVLFYILDDFLNEGRRSFSARQVRKHTGVLLDPEMKGRVLAAVYREILRDALPGPSLLATLEGCGACPSQADLVLPTEEDLERMRRDLMQDGVPLVGYEAPDFVLRDLKGRKVKLERFRGRPLAIAFWSPTCAHSLREVAELQQVGERYGNTDLAILAVVFSDEDRRSLEELAREIGVELPVLICKDGALRLAYQTNLVPTVVLIDRQGNLVKRLVGYKNPVELEAAIAALF